MPDEPATTTDSAAQPDPLKVPQDRATSCLALPGVDGGAGILTAPVAFFGEDGKPFASSATGRLWITDDDLNPLSVTKGEAPRPVGRSPSTRDSPTTRS